MKPSLAPAGRKPLDRQTAWGCLTTNLAVPGVGSLRARRFAGCFQAPLGVAGLVLTFTFGLRFIAWFFANRERFDNPEEDPVATLVELWRVVRWPLLGIGLFALAWLWALVTSLNLLQQARKEAQAAEGHVPPKICLPAAEGPGKR